jgi:vancomycin resistance protein YoaR
VTDGPDRPLIDDLADDGATDSDGRDRRFLGWLLATVVLVLGGLYLAGYAFAGDRLPRNTEVAGVEVGGLSPDRAEQVLADRLADRLDAPVQVAAGDHEVSWDADDVGLDVDVPASVGQVPVGRSWKPSHLWETLVGGEEYDPVVVTVDDLLVDRLTRLAERVGEPPVEGTVRFTRSGPEPTYPERGTTLDVDAAVAAVVAAYPSGEVVELEVVDDEPEVSRAEVSRAMDEFATPAMAAPVTYRLDGKSVVLRPGAYAPALSMAAEDGRLVPQVDRKKLTRALAPRLRGLATRPRDASFEIVDGRPRVVPATKGVTVDRKRVAATFLDLVAAKDGKRERRLPTRVREPELTTAEARDLGVEEKVSEFTTYYPHADYRNVNIGRAAELIDGTLLEPGQTFSMNEVVGERTAENGFTKGFVISNGIFAEDYGGGVSQVATTTFNAAFFAGLEDVEHKPHSFYIDRYPVGREATVAWPSLDLRFRNDTGHGVLVETLHTPSSWSGSGALTVRMWSTKVWDIESRTGERYAYTSPDTRVLTGEECYPNEGYSGFQIDVTRVFRRPGESEVHREETMHTTYTPSDTVICR